MPKFLTGYHYNEEEINGHLKKYIGYWLVQINDNKFATGQILKNPIEVVKGRILASWVQKSLEPWFTPREKCQSDHGVRGPQKTYFKAYTIHWHGPMGFVVGEAKEVIW